jgi:hypothetical protein
MITDLDAAGEKSFCVDLGGTRMRKIKEKKSKHDSFILRRRDFNSHIHVLSKTVQLNARITNENRKMDKRKRCDKL